MAHSRCLGNDYGESSYICDIAPSQIVQGAERYTAQYPHSAIRATLPYYISAFKSGSFDIDLPGDDLAVAWYRTTPAKAGPDGGEYATLLCLLSDAN